MSEYVARIGTSNGEIVERIFVFESEDSLRRDLDQKGFYVFSIQRKSGGLAGIFRRKRRLPRREFTIFNHEMATLLKAGLPLLQGLDILLERMQSPLFRDLLRDVRDQVKGGGAMSDAFAAHPEYFPPLYAASLRAGERSGELETVIRRYMAYTKVVEEVRKRVSQALIYPAFLLSVSLIVIYILLTFAIPRFAGLYNTFGGELPMLTKTLIAISDAVNQHWLLVLLGAVGTIVGLRLWSERDSGRMAIDRAKLRLPLLGNILQKFALSQLTRALSTLLSGGIPLVSALEVSADSVGNSHVAARVRGVVHNIREGESLSAALEKTGVMQPLVVEMVKVGESTGALADMLENVSEYFDEDVSEDLQRFLTILEPLLLVTMGVVIATMLLAMYMPIFDLQSVIQ